jgi:hypothetical protein
MLRIDYNGYVNDIHKAKSLWVYQNGGSKFPIPARFMERLSAILTPNLAIKTRWIWFDSLRTAPRLFMTGNRKQ